MAQYPEFSISVKSSVEVLDGRQVVRATNGALRSRSMWDTDKLKLTIVHVGLSEEDWATIIGHYRDHKISDFQVAYSGSMYFVQYVSTPRRTNLGAGVLEVTVELEEV